MSINRRQFERLKLSEDAIALHPSGTKLGKVSSAGGGGFLIYPTSPEASVLLTPGKRLTITVHEPAPILGNNPGENPIARALRRAWKNFISLVAGVIASLGVVIPLALVAVAGWMGYRRWRSRQIRP